MLFIIIFATIIIGLSVWLVVVCYRHGKFDDGFVSDVPVRYEATRAEAELFTRGNTARRMFF